MPGWMLLVAIGFALMLTGLVGCFVPVLPGPAIAYAALWILCGYGFLTWGVTRLALSSANREKSGPPSGSL